MRAFGCRNERLSNGLVRNSRKTVHGRAATIARVSSLYGGADARPFALLTVPNWTTGWIEPMITAEHGF
jgi:hypothetical protein